MWYFLGLAVFKVELLAPEVRSKFKKKIDGNAVSKKKSRPQFLEFLKILASDPRKLYFLGSDARIFKNSKNCGRLYFF